MALVWPNKDPEEVLDFPVNFNDWVVSGASIANGQAVIESTDGDDTANPLVIDQVQFASNIINVWLSGGVSGVKYVFKITATDDAGVPGPRIGVRRVKLTCKVK